MRRCGTTPSANASTSSPVPPLSCSYIILFGSGYAGLGLVTLAYGTIFRNTLAVNYRPRAKAPLGRDSVSSRRTPVHWRPGTKARLLADALTAERCPTLPPIGSAHPRCLRAETTTRAACTRDADCRAL